MIDRYSLPEMAAVWSEERKLAVWKEVENGREPQVVSGYVCGQSCARQDPGR